MRPYLTKRFEECADVASIQEEGRASHVGKLKEKCGVYKSYIRKAKKRKAIRRSLKRADRIRAARLFTGDL